MLPGCWVRVFVDVNDDNDDDDDDDDSGVRWLIKYKNHQSVLSPLWPLTWHSFPFFYTISMVFSGDCWNWPATFIFISLFFKRYLPQENKLRSFPWKNSESHVNYLRILSVESRWKHHKSQMLRVFSFNRSFGTISSDWKVKQSENKNTHKNQMDWKRKTKTKERMSQKKQSLYQRQEITWRWYAKPTKANDGKADNNNKQSRRKCSNSIDESNQNWISNNFLSSLENAYLLF